MKNILFLSILTLLFANAFSYQGTYIYSPNSLNKTNSVYNNSNYYYRPYFNKDSSIKNNILRKLQNIVLQEIYRRNYNKNFVSYKKNNGNLTGYSVPIREEDIYTYFDDNKKTPRKRERIREKSPLCNQEIFSVPTGNEFYYQDGRFYRNSHGADGKMGVTIIYD